MQTITEFKGKYRWLSNFVECHVHVDNFGMCDLEEHLKKDFNLYDDYTLLKENDDIGGLFPSIENAYQFMKSPTEEWYNICKTSTPGKVKRLSRKIKLRKDWEDVKVEVMTYLLVQKFSNGIYRDLLIRTGDAYIQEGNYWNDKFWGVCLKTGEGKNTLGNIIMDIRKSIFSDMDNLINTIIG